MKIISLNSGSSSVKIKLYDMTNELVLASASYERVGFDNSFAKVSVKSISQEILFNKCYTHENCIFHFFEYIKEENVINDIYDISCVGHRVVMGADYFSKSVVIDNDVEKKIFKLYDLAPLHNPHNHHGIKAIKKLAPDMLQTATFDTAFHQSIPVKNQIFPIDYKYYEMGIKRYGAHGISVDFIVEEYAKMMNKEKSDVNIIVAHLGNGSSITSIKDGKSTDTSMGYSPLGGIVMGTRSGDLDPSVVLKLLELEGDIKHVNDILNKNSGLKGISGISNDLRDILRLRDTNERAKLAYDIFIKRVVEKIGSYAIKNHKLEAVILTAGIGENSFDIHHDIQKYLGNIGFENDDVVELENGWTRFSATNSKLGFYCKNTDEELKIARSAKNIIEGK